jgi:hypothetical protein
MPMESIEGHSRQRIYGPTARPLPHSVSTMMRRRTMMRRARSQTRRPLLLADLERRYLDGS